MAAVTYATPPVVDKLQQRALVAGIAGLALCVVIALISPAQFFRSYLVAYIFWVGIAVGCLPIVMLHHLSGGAWGLVIRRLLESGTRTIPLMALLFAPIAAALFLHQLYEWADPAAVDRSPILQQKVPYLNVPFFLARTIFYFAVWIALTYFLNKWSGEQDRTADPRLQGRLQNLSGPGLVLIGLTVTFAAVDWVMSLEPEWFSTIFGLLIMAGWGVSALAFAIAVAVWLANREPLAGVIAPTHFHDLGKLLLAFVMVWAYFSFSQFLIIWSGNLPEEIPWYLRRLTGGWQWVGLALVLLHFVLPFVLLLSRDLKRDARRLRMVALLVIVMRFVDLVWTIAPAAAATAVSPSGEHSARSAVHFNLFDLGAPFIASIGVGGIWLWWFAWQLKKRSLLPFNDPGFEKVLSPVDHH